MKCKNQSVYFRLSLALRILRWNGKSLKQIAAKEQGKAFWRENFTGELEGLTNFFSYQSKPQTKTLVLSYCTQFPFIEARPEYVGWCQMQNPLWGPFGQDPFSVNTFQPLPFPLLSKSRKLSELSHQDGESSLHPHIAELQKPTKLSFPWEKKADFLNSIYLKKIFEKLKISLLHA